MTSLILAAVLTGSYTCQGVQGGKPYTMHLVIQELGETYELAWSAQAGEAPILAGLGVPDGERLAVALVSPSGGIGAASYTVSPGRLVGVWTRGDGSIDTEVCTSGRAA